jgi:DNA-binding CsgD family transcriptional regulator
MVNCLSMAGGGTSPNNDDSEVLSSALAAANESDWHGVYALLSPHAGLGLPSEGFELLASSAARIGQLSEASTLLERAYSSYLSEGDKRAAIRCALFLVGLNEVFGLEPGQSAWEQTARRLAEDIGPCVEHGYIALSRTGCNYPDPKVLGDNADLAMRLAVEFGDSSLMVRAKAEKSLALISQGYVNAGFALLDEVMAAIVAGECSDADVRGRTLCSVLSACERAGDIARINYWCDRIEREPYLQHAALFIHCRMVYGAVDAMRGNWEQAESHLSFVVEAAAGHQAACAAKLAEIRLHQGRVAEAAALLKGLEDEFVAVPVLARLRLSEDRPDLAAGLLRTAIRGFGHDALRLAPVLSLMIEVELRRDQGGEAESWLQRLAELEARCESNEIRALARLGAGMIAQHKGDLATAAEEFEIGLTLLTHYDRPLLAARIRIELARTLVAQHNPGAATVECEAAITTFRRLGMNADAAATEELLRSLDWFGALKTPSVTSTGSSTLSPREREVASLVAEGLTNRDIAERLVLSVRTVEGHIDRVLGKLDLHTRTQLALWVNSAPDAAASAPT